MLLLLLVLCSPVARSSSLQPDLSLFLSIDGHNSYDNLFVQLFQFVPWLCVVAAALCPILIIILIIIFEHSMLTECPMQRWSSYTLDSIRVRGPVREQQHELTLIREVVGKTALRRNMFR
jgi:hypothetical protein